jgi:hypothetical protein
VGSTQEHLPIQAIHDDIVVLKDGSAAMILKTSAVNFDLLSGGEQLAIISSFAGMLNSLSFAIQIVVRSKRLDVTDYLQHLTEVEKKQTNTLLKEMMKRYRTFVETLTQQNEVLDKQFYVVIPVSFLEIGIAGNVEKNMQKAMTLLIPRRDHIIKQLARIGLKATQLDSQKLVALFYDIYNESYQEQDIRAFVDQKIEAQNSPEVAKKPLPQAQVKLTPKPVPPPPPPVIPQPAPPQIQQMRTPQPQPAMPPPLSPPPIQQMAIAPNSIPASQGPVFEPYYLQTRTPQPETTTNTTIETLFQEPKSGRPTTPFVVEELLDEYGAAT